MWGPHLLLTAPLGIVNVHTYTGLCRNSDQYLLSGTRKDHPVGCQAGWVGGWFASTTFLLPCWVYPIGELQKRRPWAGSCSNTWPSSSISFSFLGIVSLRGIYPDLDIEETGNFIYIFWEFCVRICINSPFLSSLQIPLCHFHFSQIYELLLLNTHTNTCTDVHTQN